MPKFLYQARKGPKELKTGTIEADHQAAAVNKLTQMGFFPISVSLQSETARSKDKTLTFSKRVKHRELSVFTRQLSNLLESGLTMFKALTVLEQQTEYPALKLIIQDLANLVKEGKSFSESLALYPRVFNNMFVSMARAGEVSGTLEKVLRRLADFGEKQQDLRGKIQAAMAYPILMATVGAATVVVLFTFVIPKLVELFEDMGQVLPLPTRIMIAVSDFIVAFWWLMCAVIILGFFALRRSLLNPRGKLAFDRLKLEIPALGKFFKLSQIANFTRTLGTLLANGVPILQAMDSVAQTMGNQVLKQEVQRIAREVKEGSGVAKSLTHSKYFPVFVVNMIAIGEEGGTLDEALLKVAQTYEQDTDQSIKLFTSLIEPAMILVVGSVVGFIVISMLLPIFQISLIAR
ncbi:MAG: type II secretion system F family protein [Candidatus Omnitrophica bacterium]|nr:type II secretion system F family protein [Candidatus Omnitrophota bacterium]